MVVADGVHVQFALNLIIAYSSIYAIYQQMMSGHMHVDRDRHVANFKSDSALRLRSAPFIDSSPSYSIPAFACGGAPLLL